MNSEGTPGEKIGELLDRLLHAEERGSDGARGLAALPGPAEGCPDDPVWQRIASGWQGGSDTFPLIEHASGCQRCGALLCYWTGVLSGEESPEETYMLDRLSSQSRGWQEQIAIRLSAEKPPARPEHLLKGKALPGLMAVAGAIAAAGLFFLFLNSSRMQLSKQPLPERLLAEAYTSHRTMTVRIPLADFATVELARRTRGAGGEERSDSVPLLEARAAISQALMKAPEDPHWLLLQARADLLNENYDPAIDTLKRLLAADPANVSVLTDLASAYIQRSKATDVATDEATALDYLAQAARLDGKNPVVLYNEAVVLQELYQYSNAIDVWHRFLAVEHDPAWADDGKRRLAEIEAREAKVKAQQSRLDPFLASPEGMLHLARSPAVITEYDEELSTIRFPQILKTAFPLPPAAPAARVSKPSSIPCDQACSNARVLLHAIAASLEESHGDRWLVDFLAGAAAPGFAEGANRLADAIDTGQHSHFADGLQNAQAARAVFLTENNAAGAARAGVEETYGLAHVLDDRRCLEFARTFPLEFANHRYPWIEAQFWAEESTCHLQQDGFGGSRASLERSLRSSEYSKYRIIHLRAFGFLASNQGNVGNREIAWEMDLQGLRTYWEGDYPAVRKLGFYYALGSVEETSHRAFCSVLLHRESLQAASELPVPQTINANRFLLAKEEIRVGDAEQARRDLDVAHAELASLPHNDQFRIASADEEILLADSYLSHDDAKAAASVLKTVASELEGMESRDLELRYAIAAGHLALLEKKQDEAEYELTRALALAESGYQNIHGIQERVAWISNARQSYAALTLLRLREGKSPIEVLAIWERYRVLSSGMPLTEWCHADDLRCLEQPLEAARQGLKDETVVGTLRFNRSMLLWTMNDRGVQVHETTIDPDSFDTLSRAFSETLAAPASSVTSLNSYGNRLAATLLSPIATALDPSRTLVFDLDDSMEFLPMAALPWKGSYLGLQFASTSVHSLLQADVSASTANGSLRGVIVGASDPSDPDVPRLPEAKSEALTVADFLVRPRVFAGRDALASSIEAAAPHAGLIHIAGHATFSNGDTRILLGHAAGNGRDWLDARDFRPHELTGCRLVVLSACSTGKREERDFGDIQDMVQTLTGDGAQMVVATHWDVDSAVSERLMKKFYSALAQGLTVPQALLQADQAVSVTDGYADPYYWAPYYVAGLSRTNLKELFRHD